MFDIKIILLGITILFLTACSNQASIEKPVIEEPALNWKISISETRCFPVSEDIFNHPIDYLPLPVAPNESIWPRIQSGLTLEYIDHKSVRQQLNWYKKHPQYFERVQKRAARYFYHIANRLHEENVPYDLILLPIVESAYEPFAYSHGQASGLWQFIPGTGKRFKLEQNWWTDERRDAVESTDAAIKYLKYLHRFFDGDWLLAIAAYNSGEGTVRKAIRKNKKAGKPTDFWHLDLPKETSAYVPKMIALTEIFRNPIKYNIELVDIANQAYFQEVELDAQLDLSQAALLADVSIEEIYYLNSGLNRWATPPSKNYRLKLPINTIDVFKKNLSKLPESQRVTWHRHIIKSGESLSVIAKKYNSNSQLIRDVNKLKNNNIVAGKTLMVPKARKGHGQYLFSETQRLSKRQNTKPKSGTQKIQYYIQPGDSWWKIAQEHKVDIKSLARWNGKSPKDTLKVGGKLVIWAKNKNLANNTIRPQKIRKVNYRVRQGDSLARIADKFNVRIKEIERWNGISSKKYLQPGQGLTVYVDVMETYQ